MSDDLGKLPRVVGPSCQVHHRPAQSVRATPDCCAGDPFDGHGAGIESAVFAHEGSPVLVIGKLSWLLTY